MEPYILLGVTAVLRSLFGWLENSLEDYKQEYGWKFWKAISIPEWRLLFVTYFRMAIPFLSLWLGFDVAPYEASWMVLMFDIGMVKFAKLVSNIITKH